MEKLQYYDNAKLIYDLYCYVDTKSKYTDHLNSFGKSINYIETLFFGYDYEINGLCPSGKYKNQLFPILFLPWNREIVLFEGKYIRVDKDDGFDELDPDMMYTTPKEVWEKEIKPMIKSIAFWDKSYDIDGIDD